MRRDSETGPNSADRAAGSGFLSLDTPGDRSSRMARSAPCLQPKAQGAASLHMSGAPSRAVGRPPDEGKLTTAPALIPGRCAKIRRRNPVLTRACRWMNAAQSMAPWGESLRCVALRLVADGPRKPSESDSMRQENARRWFQRRRIRTALGGECRLGGARAPVDFVENSGEKPENAVAAP